VVVEQMTRAKERGTGRIEAFSDGVFAVAITLLVLDIHVPQLETPSVAALAEALGHDWPSTLAFVTSFATILIMWVNHHRMFALMPRATSRLLFANGFLLLLVTAVPFPTALLSRYLTTPAAPLAAAVYAGLFVVIDLAFGLLQWTGETHRNPDTRGVGSSAIPYFIGFCLYLAAALVAFWNPYVSLGICTALWVLWAITGAAGTTTDR